MSVYSKRFILISRARGRLQGRWVSLAEDKEEFAFPIPSLAHYSLLKDFVFAKMQDEWRRKFLRQFGTRIVSIVF